MIAFASLLEEPARQAGIPVPKNSPCLAQYEADRWFRTNSRDFRKVCSIAGVDPGALRAAYLRDGLVGLCYANGETDVE